MRQQITWSYTGFRGTNKSAIIVNEFVERKNLSKIGVTQPLSELSSWKASCFAVMEDQIAKEDKKERDKAKIKSKSKRRK